MNDTAITNSPFISVIIPAYNTEHFVSKSIDSILNQTFENWELILVDDGSSDNTAAICDTYAKRDSRISVIHQKNQGVNLARKHGFQKAIGTYIYFLDSDDYVENHLFQALYEAYEKFSPDIIHFGAVMEGENGAELAGTRYQPDKTDAYIVDKDYVAADNFILTKNNRLTASCLPSRPIKRNQITDDIFDAVGQMPIIEDMWLYFKILYHCNCISVVPMVGLHYLCRNGSATRSQFSKEKIELLLHYYPICIADCAKLFPKLEKCFYEIYTIELLALLANIYRYEYSKELEEKIWTALNKKPHTLDKTRIPLSFRISYRIFRFSPKLFRFLYKIYIKLTERKHETYEK